MTDKKKAVAKKKAPAKKASKYCIWNVQPPEYNYCEKFEQAGGFDTKEEAEAYLAAHPGWPYLEVRKA